MPNNLTELSIPELAHLTATFCYLDIETLDELAHYLKAEQLISPDDTIATLDAAATAIANDVADMLHNGNLDMLFHANDIDALPDTPSSHDDLADRITKDIDNYARCIASELSKRGDLPGDVPTPKRTEKQTNLLYAINQLLMELKDEVRYDMPIGLELHKKTLQIIRLTSYRNSAYDEDGNWL